MPAKNTTFSPTRLLAHEHAGLPESNLSICLFVQFSSGATNVRRPVFTEAKTSRQAIS
jgi:hypothetical protein